MPKVAVANLYHMLAYAWRHLDLDWWNETNPVAIPDAQNLLARLLISGAGWIVHRGLDRGYVEQEQELAGIRGRIGLGVTLQRMLVQRGRAFCRFDELETDLLQNRILKTTMVRLANAAGLDSAYRNSLHQLAKAMPGVGEIRLHAGLFREVMIHGGNRHYGPVLQLCELIYVNLLVDPVSGSVQIRDFTQDERQMGHLFQSFVANFWKRRTRWNVKTEEPLNWDATIRSGLVPLPAMRMDVVLRKPMRTIVVECKFSNCIETGRFGNRTFRSTHLFQVNSYLNNLESHSVVDGNAEGMLLYPKTDDDQNSLIELCGHTLRLVTVDLNTDWESVEERLLFLVE